MLFLRFYFYYLYNLTYKCSFFYKKTIDKQMFMIYNKLVRTFVYRGDRMKKYRIKRGNKIKTMLRTIIFIFVCLLIFSFFSSYQMGNKKLPTYDIVISNSDTIWNIAKDICNSNEDLNIQNVVLDIKEINNLSSSDIYIGQTLSLPIY